ncbi:MAG: hypothetical protein AAF957_13820 [Planctomycetota bacterium]
MRSLALTSTVVLAGLHAAPRADAQHLLSTLSGDGLGDRMQFGANVVWDGETAAIRQREIRPGGSQRNHVRMYERDGVSLAFTELLEDPTAPFSIGFGASMAIQADELVVSAPGTLPGFPGQFYVYRRFVGGWGVDQIVYSNGASLYGSRFGSTVKLEGDVLMAAAPFADVTPGNGSEGTVVVHERQPTGWVETQRLTMPGPGSSRFFGTGLDVHGDQAVIGAPGHEVATERTGGAWIFRRTGSTWALEDELQPVLPPEDESKFGFVVAIEGDVAAVAAQTATVGGLTRAGRVYVFERTPTGWVETANLTAQTPGAFDLFGATLSFSQGVLAVGSQRFVHSDSEGEVHVFRRDASGWQLADVLLPPGPAPNPFRAFGGVVSAADGALLVADGRSVLGQIDPGDAQLYDLDVDTTRHCSSTINASGAAAIIYGDGSRTVASDRFRLRAENVPTGFGLFFHGAARADLPLGAGRLCVGGPSLVRSPAVPAAGSMSLDVDFNAPWGAALVPGATRSFQAWFRDGASGFGFQSSDAVEITFR